MSAPTYASTPDDDHLPCSSLLQRVKTILFGITDELELAQLNRIYDDITLIDSAASNRHNLIIERFSQQGPLRTANSSRLGIPTNIARFYDPDTGWLDYKPTAPTRLAVENGDADLSVLRVHIDNVEKFSSDAAADFLNDLTHLMQVLPDIQLWIVTPPTRHIENEFTAAYQNISAQIRTRITLVQNTSSTYFRIWAQDGSKPVLAASPTTLLPEASQFDSDIEPTIALNNRGLVVTHNSPFYFEGGDIVVGAQHIFVGATVIDQAVTRLRVTRTNAIQALSAYFTKPVVDMTVPSLQHGTVPLSYHTDLSLAVVRDKQRGDEVVVMTSVRLFIEQILRVPDFNHLDQATYNQAVTTALQRVQTADEELVLNGLLTIPLKRLKLAQRRIDFVKRHTIEPLGYRIVEVSGINDDLTRLYRGYTNVVVSNRIAAVPHLNIQRLDYFAMQQFQALGYTVVPMMSAARYFLSFGGPRCAMETYRCL